MKVRGIVNFEGTDIHLNEKNVTQFVVDGGMVMITVNIDGKEQSFRENSIKFLKIVHIEDVIVQELQEVEAKIASATSK